MNCVPWDVSANMCNLKDGDEILSVNGHAVASLNHHEEVVKVMSAAIQSGNICLQVNRMGSEGK